jgi:hypothetical protein
MNTGFRPNRSASPPQKQGTKQDSSQGGRHDQSFIDIRERKLLTDQGQANPLHEHDHPLEKLPGRGQGPYQPLHRG